MRGNESVAERTSRVAAWHLFVLVLVSLVALTVLYRDESRPPPVACVYVLLACVPLTLALITRIMRLGDAAVPPLLFWAGCAFMAGGSALDVTITLVHTPDLSRESNPIARVLLDSGHSLPVVYLVGAIGQAGVLLWGCLALAAFLRHRDAVVRSAWAVGPRSAGEFVRAAISGRRLTVRQFLFAAKASEFPRAYQLVCLLHLCVAPAWIGRWYLGLGWLDLVPDSMAFACAAAAVAMVLAVLAYTAWLRRQYALGLDAHSQDDATSGPPL